MMVSKQQSRAVDLGEEREVGAGREEEPHLRSHLSNSVKRWQSQRISQFQGIKVVLCGACSLGDLTGTNTWRCLVSFGENSGLPVPIWEPSIHGTS